MPIISSNYKPPLLFREGHFSTIYSAKLRPQPKLKQQRERITLNDGDFIDLDWSFSKKQNIKVVILLHGLEGNSQRTYMKGAGAILVEHQWDVVAMNFRGCSGVVNLKYESYHGGKTNDLHEVIQYILEKDSYQEIVLVGFSLGGNLLLKYLGEKREIPKQIKKGVAISTPLSLKGSLEALTRHENWVYRTTFLKTLRKKCKEKMELFPERMNEEMLKKITSLLAFDDIYTAPAHGFKDAYDYYKKNSSLQFLPTIQVPVLLINAKNDSFLSKDCYPYEFAKKSNTFFFENPNYGGHVGFYASNKKYYSELRTLEFLK